MLLPIASPGDEASWVDCHLAGLFSPDGSQSPIRGGRTQALIRLNALDLTGYSAGRNQVFPPETRTATGLSPFIRHGVLTLREVWDRVEKSLTKDRSSFRNELLWQEYARHLYARVGEVSNSSLRFHVNSMAVPSTSQASDASQSAGQLMGEPLCVRESERELEQSGWLTNQQRMWLSAHFVHRQGKPWQAGEDIFFQHLLDGSRAANRLGWQWVSGALTGRPYYFSRWQVELRAPGLCHQCALQSDCPIDVAPDPITPLPKSEQAQFLRSVPKDHVVSLFGPSERTQSGQAEAVWITAELLSKDDETLQNNPGLPVIFVFDEKLLKKLQLSRKRLIFLAQCLSEVAQHRELVIYLGDPRLILAKVPLAATFAPVPGWKKMSQQLKIVDVNPWPWLVQPVVGSAASFTAWSKQISIH